MTLLRLLTTEAGERESLCDCVCGDQRVESLVTRSDWAGEAETPDKASNMRGRGHHQQVRASHTGTVHLSPLLIIIMEPEKLDPIRCCEVMKAVHGDRSQGRWTDLE